MTEKQQLAKNWFKELRDMLCNTFEAIEDAYVAQHQAKTGKTLPAGRFNFKPWQRSDGGGGVMGIMHGQVFEKVGVNISTVWGSFEPEFAKKIPGTTDDTSFWASGVSLVAHMRNPHVPAAHFNTRMIQTQKSWFGGGGDLTPCFAIEEDTQIFHKAFKKACDFHDPDYYPRYKKWCDDYFYLPHRNESRGVGGIFFDYHDSGSWQQDFAFTKDVGLAFHDSYSALVRKNMYAAYSKAEREALLVKRGRYVEFNLLYDRGTLFGLKTNGNTEAILMSMPPEVRWP